MTAIWYSTDDDRIVIEGALQTYAPRTLMTVVDGDTIMVRLKVNTRNEFGPASYTTITDQGGNGFADMASAVAYLNDVFAHRRVVGSPERNYALPPSSGAPAFPLAPEPADVNTVALVVNGVAYYPPDIAASSLSVTWQGPFPLDLSDALRVVYF